MLVLVVIVEGRMVMMMMMRAEVRVEVVGVRMGRWGRGRRSRRVEVDEGI